MKKIFATLAILGAMTFGLTSNVLAQDDEFFQEESEQVVEEAAEAAPAAEEVAPAAAPAAAPVAAPAAPAQEQPAVEEEVSMFKALKIKFIEGDAFFMSFVALCLIIGLALCIERIIYLSLAATNTKKLLEKVEAYNYSDANTSVQITPNSLSIKYSNVSDTHDEDVTLFLNFCDALHDDLFVETCAI